MTLIPERVAKIEAFRGADNEHFYNNAYLHQELFMHELRELCAAWRELQGDVAVRDALARRCAKLEFALDQFLFARPGALDCARALLKAEAPASTDTQPLNG